MLPLLLVMVTVQSLDAQALRGHVADSTSGESLAGVSVIVNHRQRAFTATDGTFEAPDVVWRQGSNRIEFRLLGYAPLVIEPQINSADSVLMLDAALAPLAIRMTGVVVEGERLAIANPGLLGFYERREEGFGRYLTGEEIDRAGGPNLTNSFRRLRMHYGEFPVKLSVYGPLFPACLVAYLDGIRVMDPTRTINQRIPLSQIGGLEVYRTTEYSHIPGKFVAPGSCGVVMLWSKKLK